MAMESTQCFPSTQREMNFKIEIPEIRFRFWDNSQVTIAMVAVDLLRHMPEVRNYFRDQYLALR